MATHPLTLLYSPFPSHESARAAATALLTEKLVACCNLLPSVESHYWWEGKLEQATEVVLMAKTSEKYAKEAMARIKALHPYECPAILAFAPKSTPEYAAWVAENLAG